MKEDQSSSEYMMEIHATIKGIKIIKKYFECHKTSDTTFEPEFIATEKIIGLLECQPIDFEYINEIIKETERTNHYNGSGWHNLKIRLKYIARLFNSNKG